MIDWLKNINKEYPVFWKSYLAKFEGKSNRYVVLSTETTGLNPKKDVILSFGAVAVVNDIIRIGDNFEVVILQYKYLHDNGLSNEFLIESKLSKLAEPQAMQALVEYIGNAVLVGHRIHFDIEMINDVLEKMDCGKLKNEALDIEIMHQKLMDMTNKSFSLEDLIKQYKLPLNEKKSYLYNAQERGAQTGYFPFKSENAKGYSAQDLKEFFHYAPYKKTPEIQAQMTKEYFEKVTQLAHELLKWAENGLPDAVSKNLSMPLSQMAKESTLTLLRILHYPPLQGDEEKDALRAAPHEDINLITLLPFATAPGLQIKDSKGNWHTIPGDPGMIVINVGDMLAHCTQNYYSSTTHRVVNPKFEKNRARYSLPLFFQPNNDVRLSSTHTAGSYFEERFREQGLVKDKD